MAHFTKHMLVGRVLATALFLTSIPEARAQSCTELSSEASRLNMQAATMLLRSPGASAVTVSCAAASNKLSSGMQKYFTFAGCVTAACYVKGDFTDCTGTAMDWYSNLSRREAIAEKQNAQRC